MCQILVAWRTGISTRASNLLQVRHGLTEVRTFTFTTKCFNKCRQQYSLNRKCHLLESGFLSFSQLYFSTKAAKKVI